jgi:NAD(P)-dependent dehydrogenase (short-subunit alcohol dehydrogenase family)
MRAVVITGVSSGIGRASSQVLIANGFHVFGSVRKEADAQRVAADLGPQFTPLLFDVTDEPAIAVAADKVRDRLAGTRLAGLVNNAGIAVVGPVLDLPLSEYRRQFEINVFGHIAVTKAFAPLLGTDPTLRGDPGRIVMMTSVAGRNGDPFMSAYCSSKHALEGLAESLRRELTLYGIDVLVVAPGAVKTPIWDKPEGTDISPFVNSPFYPALQKLQVFVEQLAKSGLPAEDIGKAVHRALTDTKPKIRTLVTPSPVQHAIRVMLPKRLVDRIIASRLGLRKA